MDSLGTMSFVAEDFSCPTEMETLSSAHMRTRPTYQLSDLKRCCFVLSFEKKSDVNIFVSWSWNLKLFAI